MTFAVRGPDKQIVRCPVIVFGGQRLLPVASFQPAVIRKMIGA